MTVFAALGCFVALPMCLTFPQSPTCRILNPCGKMNWHGVQRAELCAAKIAVRPAQEIISCDRLACSQRRFPPKKRWSDLCRSPECGRGVSKSKIASKLPSVDEVSMFQ